MVRKSSSIGAAAGNIIAAIITAQATRKTAKPSQLQASSIAMLAIPEVAAVPAPLPAGSAAGVAASVPGTLSMPSIPAMLAMESVSDIPTIGSDAGGAVAAAVGSGAGSDPPRATTPIG